MTNEYKIVILLKIMLKKYTVLKKTEIKIRMSDQENEVDMEDAIDDLEEEQPSAIVSSGHIPDDAEIDEDDEINKAVPKDKRITVYKMCFFTIYISFYKLDTIYDEI